MNKLRQLRLFPNFRFNAKLKRNPLSSIEKQRIAEEMDRQTNIEVLKREMFNDTMQLPIKFTAYYITNQQTFWAEFVRSGIDATNHLILFSTNYINYGPNSKFPYGIEKVKNMVVLIPAGLFLYFGVEITFESVMNLYNYSTYVGEGHQNIYALALYLLSIGIETTIIAKNIIDAQKIDAYEEGKKPSLLTQFKDLFQKKDPLLQAVLYENAITLISTLVPLIASSAAFIYPTPLFEILGSLSIGCIQLNLGYHLLSKNISKLIGEESLDKTDLDKLNAIIKGNKFVAGVQNEKAVMLGSRNFRFAAEITFNTAKINKEIQSDSQDQIEKIIYTESYKDREEYLEELLQDVQNQMMASIHKEIHNIEDAIKSEFPNCRHLDLEINQKSLADIYNTDESNSLFVDSKVNPGIQFEKWMLEEADRLINKMKKKKDQSYFANYQDYCKSAEYSIWQDQPDNMLHEDYRFEELNTELQRRNDE